MSSSPKPASLQQPIAPYIRTIPDFPSPGILFRDITPLLLDADGFAAAVEQLVAPYRHQKIDKVAGIEARGFILGACVAHQLNAGFVAIRKKGRLPSQVLGMDYELEYGFDRVELHADSFKPGERILLVDDLIATGGTAQASATLIQNAGGELVAAAFVVDLPELGGSQKLKKRNIEVHTLCEFRDEE